MKTKRVKKLIKPNDGFFIIIWKLNRIKRKIPIYDAGIPEDNHAYGRIHNLLWEIDKAGYISYGRDPALDGNVMYAQIKSTGRAWIWKRIIDAIAFVCILISAIGTIIMLAR